MKKVGRISVVCLLAVAVLAVCSLRRAVEASSGSVSVPILMYHSVGYNKVASRYILAPEDFERDLIWLCDHGYTSVLVSDLIRYADGEGDLPERPVVITLDDGFLNNLTYVLPLLERYGMCAVVSVVGSFCDAYTANPDPDPAYAYLTWSDVATLAASGRVEIANHTYAMHAVGERRGCMKKSDETPAAYAEVLRADLRRVQTLVETHTGGWPRCFAYPYGAVSGEAAFVLESLGIRAALTCEERTNTLRRSDRASLFRLGRFNRPSGEATQAFMTRVLGNS